MYRKIKIFGLDRSLWELPLIRRPWQDRPPASKKVDYGIWLVSFMDYDLGYIDLEETLAGEHMSTRVRDWRKRAAHFGWCSGAFLGETTGVGLRLVANKRKLTLARTIKTIAQNKIGLVRLPTYKLLGEKPCYP